MDHDHLTPAEVASLLGASGCPQLEQEHFHRSFRQWYRQLGDTLSVTLAELLAGNVSVQGTSLAKVSFGEFVLSTRGESCVLRATTQPDFGPLFLDLAPFLPGMIVDRMLGGRGRSPDETYRPANEIDNRLARQAYQRLAGAFCSLWAEILPMNLADVQREDDLTRLHLLRADELMTVAEYAVRHGSATSTLRWIVPDEWPVRMVRQAVAAYCPAHSSWESANGRPDGLQVATHHEVVAELAAFRMDTDELSDLQPGDILQTDMDVGEPLTIRLDGIARFRANLGKVSDRKAVEIVEVLDQAASDGDLPIGQIPDSDSVGGPIGRPAVMADDEPLSP